MTDELPIWTPDPARLPDTQLARFAAFAHPSVSAPDYAGLWAWSVRDPGAFWSAFYDFCGVIGDRGPGPVLLDGHLMPGAQWFVGTRLNFAENLLRTRGPGPAIVACDERGTRRTLSWDELNAEVARVADGLRSAGVVAGDRVAGFLPNLP